MKNKKKIHNLLKIISNCDTAIDMADEFIESTITYKNRRIELRDETIDVLKLIDKKWEGTLALMSVLRKMRRK